MKRLLQLSCLGVVNRDLRFLPCFSNGNVISIFADDDLRGLWKVCDHFGTLDVPQMSGSVLSRIAGAAVLDKQSRGI